MKQGSFIEGEFRKRWHPHIPMEENVASPRLATGGPESSNETLADTMQSEIEKLKTKTENHLKVPQVKTKSPYRKTTMFLTFLGLVFLGLVFFSAGFMVCFYIFPPQYSAVTLAASSPDVQQGQANYAVRNNYIAGASGTPQRNGLLTQIEKQTELTAQRRAQEAVAQTTDAINSKITNALGYRAESILEPITKGIAGLLINSIADPKKTGMSYNTPGVRYQGSQSVPPQAGNANQSVLPQTGNANQSVPVSPEINARTSTSAVSSAVMSNGIENSGSQAPIKAEGSDAHKQITTQNATTETALQKAQEKSANATEASGGHAGMYAVEMSTFDQSQDAYVQMTDMRKRGYDAYIVRVVVGPDLVYSLRFGNFKSYQDARDAVQGFRSLWGQPARVVITSPQDDRMGFK